MLKRVIKKFFVLMLFLIILLILGGLGVAFMVIAVSIGRKILGVIGAIIFAIFSFTLSVFLIEEMVMWIDGKTDIFVKWL